MNPSDWNVVETRLMAFTLETIRQLATNVPRHTISTIAYYAFPASGQVALSFDTPANSLHFDEEQASVRRRSMVRHEWWEDSEYYLSSSTAQPYNDDSGSFTHEMYQEVFFEDWEPFAFSETYPRPQQGEATTSRRISVSS
jgi:hypothetical protein